MRVRGESEPFRGKGIARRHGEYACAAREGPESARARVLVRDVFRHCSRVEKLDYHGIYAGDQTTPSPLPCSKGVLQSKSQFKNALQDGVSCLV